MTIQIKDKIVGFKVITKDQSEQLDSEIISAPEPDRLHEGMERPEVLVGSTYKLKTPKSDHAIYLTINDIVLNEGTEHEERRPYEMFIISKNMENFPWVVVLTRVISAVFRKGGEITFLVDELKAIFDPAGGYFKKGGIFMPSVVAEIGHVLEKHLKAIGIIKAEEPDKHMLQYLADKRRELEEKNNFSEDSKYPASATLCPKCSVKAFVRSDGCTICLSCGHSHCG